VLYNFEWDPGKALKNSRKHKISFERATNIFYDPNAITVYDKAHSNYEERWITLGVDKTGALIVACHTFEEEKNDFCRIRTYSARKATRNEEQQYQGC